MLFELYSNTLTSLLACVVGLCGWSSVDNGGWPVWLACVGGLCRQCLSDYFTCTGCVWGCELNWTTCPVVEPSVKNPGVEPGVVFHCWTTGNRETPGADGAAGRRAYIQHDNSINHAMELHDSRHYYGFTSLANWNYLPSPENCKNVCKT